MKPLVRLFALATMILTLSLGWGLPTWASAMTGVGAPSVRLMAEAERGPVRNVVEDLLGKLGQRIDLNNTNISAFRKIPGLYPTAARVIVQNAPYEKVEDILNLPGLTEAQKERVRENLDKFTLGPINESLERDRINNGIYR
ncbi:photosystem II complex extrinsic protein PsbU [Leptolyngbya sp. FACHB-261]|uniref:photosystem II complex extrinsic protein PsbU n=1 Tax=Leptolyngbya sp. FACHB-261 TaxID=2692806 RepID=UPI0016857C86|nr:photosystem II complex extrinsic protein PsbU [Leptolyngbya sp. FACHB-261]MBD2101344.1 photosystem II complex extrinsic protein PsbU [Leptolyngbya sp. FACHB-261]